MFKRGLIQEFSFAVIIGLVMMLAISAVASELSNELADDLTNAKDAKQSVTAEFEQLFVSVTDQLSNRQDKYINDPIAYHAFLVSTVVELWDSSSTTRALLGKKHYESLAKEQKSALISAVDGTLIRYAFEGLESYSGQVFKVDDVVINEEKGMGWVQVLMVSPVIPDINLDLLIKRNPQGDWRAVDVRVKGITYVAIKKHGYREIFEEKGFDSLLVKLSDKNKEYFKVVCESAGMNKMIDQKGKAPC